MYSSVRAPRRRERHAERVELLFQPADADAELDASAREAVERRELLGEDERVALRQDQDPGREADARRRGRDVREPDERVGDGNVLAARHLSGRASTGTPTGSPSARRRARRSTATRSRAPRRAARARRRSRVRRTARRCRTSNRTSCPSLLTCREERTVHRPPITIRRCESGSWGRRAPRAVVWRLGSPASVTKCCSARGPSTRRAPRSTELEKEWGDRVAGRLIACDNAWACDAPVVILAVHADGGDPDRAGARRAAARQDRRLDGEQPREARQRVQRGAAAARLGRGRDPGAAVAVARLYRVPPRARGGVRRRSTTRWRATSWCSATTTKRSRP